MLEQACTKKPTRHICFSAEHLIRLLTNRLKLPRKLCEVSTDDELRPRRRAQSRASRQAIRRGRRDIQCLVVFGGNAAVNISITRPLSFL